jgi:preprotein translocase subunit SecG
MILNVVVGVILVFSCFFLITFILLHSGRGSGLSDLFGGGGALTGGTVVERNLDRITVVTVVIWSICVVFLGIRLSD